ncbi:phage tail tape measure protein [Nesterenkonia flava]|uniref:Phage tail tape measure protein n=1 Tax=Nesterenkonia flava TaxID=469799 RepID=A0ABU1FRV9_9MICC|nr:phage tail tape measure protein [Nesterenkonia flava]MDR5711400.1 phage tail tape measure protein [Nesterenkonia flava]
MAEAVRLTVEVADQATRDLNQINASLAEFEKTSKRANRRSQDASRKTTREMESQATGVTKAVTGVSKATTQLTGEADKASKAATGVGKGMTGISDAALVAGTAVGTSAGNFSLAGQSAAELGVTVDGLQGQLNGAGDSVSIVAEGLQSIPPASEQSRRSLDDLMNSARANEAEFRQLGTTLIGVGGAITGALGLAGAAAIQWESDWADVMRRTAGTPEQLNELEDSLRGIARELPTTHSEVTQVAASAAQLGVAVTDVEDFTRVMIDMGVATNMTAEQAATNMQRFANVMGTETSNMDRLGSAIVDLGNNSATTESEIMDMAQNLAGASRQMGMTEGDVLGISAAMASVGIESAAGGTAVSKAMYEINSSVATGNENLERLADIAGMSSEELSALWQEDAAAGLEAFVLGLGTAASEGRDLQSVLSEVGLGEVRTVRSLANMALAGDQLGNAINRGNDAWAQNVALTNEAGHVYNTTQAQITAAWAQVQDAAIDAGAYVAPVIGGMISAVGNLASGFQLLPSPVQAAVVGISGIAGVSALAAGSFLLLLPRIADTREAMRTLGFSFSGAWDSMRRLATGGQGLMGMLRRIGPVAAGAAVLLGGLAIARSLSHDVDDVTASVSQLSRELGRMASGNDFDAGMIINFDGAIGSMGRSVNDLSEAMRLADSGGFRNLQRWTGDLVGITTASHAADQAVANLDEAILGAFHEGNFAEAAAGFKLITDEAKDLGWSADEIASNYPQMVDAIRDAATAAGQTVSDQELLKIATSEAALEALGAGAAWRDVVDAYRSGEYAASDLAGELEELENAQPDLSATQQAASDLAESVSESAAALDNFIEGLRILGLVERDATEALGNYHAQLRELAELSTSEDFVPTLDVTTEAGFRNFQELTEVGEKGFALAQANAMAGESAETVAANLNDAYTAITNWTEANGIAADQVDELIHGMTGIDPSIDFQTDTWALEAAQGMLESLGEHEGTEFNFEIAVDEQKMKESEQRIQDAERMMREFAHGEWETAIDFYADDFEAAQAMVHFTDGNHEAWIDMIADDADAQAVLSALENEEFLAQIQAHVDQQALEQEVSIMEETLRGLMEQDGQILMGVGADVEEAEATLEALQLRDFETAVQIMGDDQHAQEIIAALMSGNMQAVVDIMGDSADADAVITAFTNGDYRAMAQILAEDMQARGTMNAFTGTSWSTSVIAEALTGAAETELNNLARTRTVSIVANVTQNVTSRVSSIVDNLRSNLATGGRLPSLATGGRLPATGLGQDKILGVTGDGTPLAWVDDREWVINRGASDKYDRVLGLINQDSPMVQHLAADPGYLDRGLHAIEAYANGGRPATSAPAPSAPAHTGNGGGTTTLVRYETRVEAPISVTVQANEQGHVNLEQLREALEEILRDSETRDYGGSS